MLIQSEQIQNKGKALYFWQCDLSGIVLRTKGDERGGSTFWGELNTYIEKFLRVMKRIQDFI